MTVCRIYLFEHVWRIVCLFLILLIVNALLLNLCERSFDIFVAIRCHNLSLLASENDTQNTNIYLFDIYPCKIFHGNQRMSARSEAVLCHDLFYTFCENLTSIVLIRNNSFLWLRHFYDGFCFKRIFWWWCVSVAKDHRCNFFSDSLVRKEQET